MASISGLSILVVDDDEDSCDLLEMFLEGEGARVTKAADAGAAREALAAGVFDAILSDATLPGEDGFSLIASLRASDDVARKGIPAIAITGHADARSRQRAVAAGFQKFITKPFDVFSLPAAIASVVADTSAAPAHETKEARNARWVEAHDMRALLAALNAPTPYRYTSILRFTANEMLESVWTFDRTREGVDTFPGDMPVSASYCGIVRATAAPVQITNTLDDPRVDMAHPSRTALQSYCGVPLVRADGSFFGTLCHYDERPQPMLEGTVEEMTKMASLLSPSLPPASTPPVNP